jgi:ATP-dependent DNA helicase RecG
MNAALERLSKVIQLESERGYDNRAVMGGLERILESWSGEARASGLDARTIQLVESRLHDYERLSPASRAEMLRGLWRSVSGTPLGPADGTPTPSEPSSRRPTATAPEAPDATASATDRAVDAASSAQPAAETPAKEATPLEPPARDLSALKSPLTVIKGVGPQTAQTLERLGLSTLGDLLWYLPRRYVDYSSLKPINRLWYGEVVTVIGVLESVEARRTRGGQRVIVEAVVGDGSGALRVTWFNQPWLAQRFRKGDMLALSGRIDQYLGRLTMNSPEWELVDRQQLHTRRIVPIYGLTSGLHQKAMRRMMESTIHYWAPRVPDPLPDDIQKAGGWMAFGSALQQAHFPDTWESLRTAQRRLAFEELLCLQVGVLQQKADWESSKATAFPRPEAFEQWKASLGYPLTAAQDRTLGEILADLASGRPMNRLLQGDVGSGKTAVAAGATFVVASHHGQTAVLAPTSTLAEQHYRTFTRFLADEAVSSAAPLRPQEVALLLGSTPESEKAAIRDGLAAGTIRLVIGTHALLEPNVKFAHLDLAVIDEQHRFGVEQRAELRAKGGTPHLLVMTATPIPRSLALTVYGDLDLSLLDEMPPGRKPVTTRVMLPTERERAYSFITSQLRLGRQAFIICPLVEESETTEAASAVEEHHRLQKEIFPEWNLGLLHGRLKADEKEQVMQRFREGEVNLLVSTSVVEVGVDIPNATVMMVEGANRFGLAQLHQFRGRVGRGSQEASCMLVADSESEADNERLKAMEETHDGFILAERDLEQRGPGDFLGTRQSGFADLRLARLTDLKLIEEARAAARRLYEADPKLERPEHQLLAERLASLWMAGQGDVS